MSRFWIVAYMWLPLLAFNLFVFLLEPHMYTHISPALHHEMIGKREILLELDLFTAWLTGVIWLASSRERSE